MNKYSYKQAFQDALKVINAINGDSPELFDEVKVDVDTLIKKMTAAIEREAKKTKGATQKSEFATVAEDNVDAFLNVPQGEDNAKPADALGYDPLKLNNLLFSGTRPREYDGFVGCKESRKVAGAISEKTGKPLTKKVNFYWTENIEVWRARQEEADD